MGLLHYILYTGFVNVFITNYYMYNFYTIFIKHREIT